MSNDFIPVNEPFLGGNEKKYLNECIDTGWISSEGPFVGRFEEQLAKRIGRKYGIAVANGSAALDVAIAALRIRAGDEVILPTFTIISCATAIVRAGGTPVVVDCEPDTWNMDVNQIEAKITKKTKAIMVVHIYGLPVDMDPVLALAKKYGLKVIEDAAQAIGLTYKGKECGSFGDISTFSFYPNKHVTTGEGGMVMTDDKDLAERCRSLRNLCFNNNKRFVHEELGWNYRMTNLQAAIGVAQLERLDMTIQRKREIGIRYSELLCGIGTVQMPVKNKPYADNIYWVYGLVIKSEFQMEASGAALELSKRNIGTRPFFYPMHQQPALKNLGFNFSGEYSVSENIYKKGFYVPSGLALTDEQQTRVCESLIDIFRA
ncbi:MAG: DegT/DnrJ/EryC1/StrS family aminotransferase [Gammaproteobacteria bacterium]|nr:DegT/DnrJ/EryC1/StrS family aminotransferase [Gammaproteobacteria bacterium]